MKKFGMVLLFFTLFSHNANAVNLVKKVTYFDNAITIAGLPDYPPFAFYENNKLAGALIGPTIEIMKNQGITIVPAEIDQEERQDARIILTGTRSGKIQLFAGAYANTSSFNGLNMLYPAAVTNPVHIFTLYDKKEENIRSVDDLKELRGVVSKTEYFNDFYLKKLQELNIELVDTPFDGYKKVIMGEADYMLGGLYYNKIMIARHGLGDYLTYSQTPLFKMPIFVAISRVTPYLSLYIEAFKTEFSKPEYATRVKEEIIRIINEETIKYSGVVPPSFSLRNADETEEVEDLWDSQSEFVDEPEFNDNITGGRIVEKPQENKPQKSVDDILEGI